MSLNSLSLVSVKAVLEKALAQYIADGNNTVITDIYLQPKRDSGTMIMATFSPVFITIRKNWSILRSIPIIAIISERHI